MFAAAAAVRRPGPVPNPPPAARSPHPGNGSSAPSIRAPAGWRRGVNRGEGEHRRTPTPAIRRAKCMEFPPAGPRSAWSSRPPIPAVHGVPRHPTRQVHGVRAVRTAECMEFPAIRPAKCMEFALSESPSAWSSPLSGPPSAWSSRRPTPARAWSSPDSAAAPQLAVEELLHPAVERDPVLGIAKTMSLGVGVGLVLDPVLLERGHREFEVQERRPDVPVSVLDQHRRSDVADAGEGLGLVVDLWPLSGKLP